MQDNKKSENQNIEHPNPTAQTQNPGTPPPPSELKEDFEVKAKQYLDQLVRLQAEFANYRKRTEKEKGEAIRFGRVMIVERMISLMDVMEQALKHSQNATDIKAMRTGFELVVSEFVKCLKLEGAEPLQTVGEFFDPHLHEALEQVETNEEKENNKIVEEIQKGYQFHGRLLRPAKVKVAKYTGSANNKTMDSKNPNPQ
jgi:molecular chaperone GrpE